MQAQMDEKFNEVPDPFHGLNYKNEIRKPGIPRLKLRKKKQVSDKV
jgi:hypothetical protein